MKEISNKSFNLFLGDEVLEKLAETLIDKSYSKVFVLVDENTEKHCWPIINNYLVNTILIKINSGEQFKNLNTAQYIWEFLQSNFADRNSVLLNLGGGVLSDVGGFCAATYKRGIDFINIPTTLLAMVDAAIGGKQGVDVQSYKNAVGVFQHPVSIFIYPDFIKTLPAIEVKNGLVELTKHGLIAKDTLWDKVQNVNIDALDKINSLIFSSIKIKTDIVIKDPLEKGSRKLLNFGHTIGHAIETYSLQNDEVPLKHGEAIAIGIICEAYISKVILGLSNKDLKSIVDFYMQYFKKLTKDYNQNALLNIMLNDKKNQEGKINFTLLKKIGKAKTNIYCPEEVIIEALNYYKYL